MLRKIIETIGRYALKISGASQGPLTDREVVALIEADGGGKSAAGMHISESAAYSYSAFYSGVIVHSETIGSLPIHVYKRTNGDERERDGSHPLAQILRRRANPEMSAMTVVETMQAHCLGWGDAYAEIEQTVGGKPLALWPMHPNYCQWDADERRYRLTIPEEREPRFLTQEKVLHIRAPLGYGLIQYARESIGLGLATEKYGSLFFDNNAMPGVMFEQTEASRLTKDTAADEFRKSFQGRHGGLSNAHRVALLPKGVAAKALAIAPELAQFLETRRFQVEEIARWLRMPVYMLRETTAGVSYASLEVQAQALLLFTFAPWLRRWQDELNYKLFSEAERDTYYAEFVTAALLRADTKTRYEAHNLALNGGWMCRDEVRAIENMPPLPDGQGKIFLTPMNMEPAGAKAKPAPAPPPEENK